MEILCVEPIYPQYSGVLETCLALRYWFFEVLGSESVKPIQPSYVRDWTHLDNYQRRPNMPMFSQNANISL